MSKTKTEVWIGTAINKDSRAVHVKPFSTEEAVDDWLSFIEEKAEKHGDMFWYDKIQTEIKTRFDRDEI